MFYGFKDPVNLFMIIFSIVTKISASFNTIGNTMFQYSLNISESIVLTINMHTKSSNLHMVRQHLDHLCIIMCEKDSKGFPSEIVLERSLGTKQAIRLKYILFISVYF